MNFEVFDSIDKMNERAAELRSQGHQVITGGVPGSYTIKWR